MQVIAREYSFTLSRPSVPAGRVVIEFVNGGQDPHNLHFTPAAGGSETAAFANTAPGVHSDVAFEMAPGAYTLFCSLPNHESAGMKATLTVH